MWCAYWAHDQLKNILEGPITLRAIIFSHNAYVASVCHTLRQSKYDLGILTYLHAFHIPSVMLLVELWVVAILPLIIFIFSLHCRVFL